ncbi:hypothetical protein BofuT4_uP048270.1 [Botrytis cinerea T4]|uniref:Uncharacterized protein n=1 Tax=Botryotinia fuckeliana (strain T4) TaxID=999810 RepID=G2XZC2_BOTF4|nr:hypothetical protein BofuT4_uP048270.1 [Botrytis cinerea T4]
MHFSQYYKHAGWKDCLGGGLSGVCICVCMCMYLIFNATPHSCFDVTFVFAHPSLPLMNAYLRRTQAFCEGSWRSIT